MLAQAKVLPAPMLVAAGISIPKDYSGQFSRMLGRADYNVDPSHAMPLNVIVFYNHRIKGPLKVYERIRDFVNSLRTYYRFCIQPFAMIEAGDREGHWGAFQCYFSGPAPENVFVLNFIKPQTSADPAYPVIKQMLAQSGFLSQFVSFKTYAHDYPREMKKSDMILQGVARQVLQKAGVRGTVYAR
jgi:hypothetical protein